MKNRARRIAVLAFTILFAGSVFTATALAEQPAGDPAPPTYEDPGTGSVATGVPVEPEPDPSEPAPSQSGSSMTSSTGSASTNESTMNSSASASSSESSENNNSGGTSNSSTSTEAPPSTPNRDPDIQVSTPSHVTNPDTQQGLINSRANALGSTDPDEQSNTDWSELLGGTASDSSEAVSAASSSAAVSSEGQKASSGGVTWMLILGVLFILLALAGIGYFIYAQFFAGRGGPKNGGPNGGGFDGNEDETDFIDISSSSDGLQHREGYLPPEKDGKRQPGAQSASLNDHTVEIPSLSDDPPIEEIVSAASDASRQPPLRNPHAVYAGPSAAAQDPAVQNSAAQNSAAQPADPADASRGQEAQASPAAQKNFDWNKFFEENSDI
ncbi:hypothetical protein DPQ25_08470 [Hydrogeniiclostridium mannosilyticum]|uniref:DUF4366 domain-containing protein n=1 Tax=Hydrogeniiclostridium mannosilyticum TaxID=2764322 RepID=A0A328UF49_9FIRM|nr:hypothetical protein [Hydrogeniiclostridium mannosilyticum]RAQ28811.1 hypothetical protein DPQ25_08470 [Hydrogeniiclostridium mannosilyticum]